MQQTPQEKIDGELHKFDKTKLRFGKYSGEKQWKKLQIFYEHEDTEHEIEFMTPVLRNKWALNNKFSQGKNKEKWQMQLAVDEEDNGIIDQLTEFQNAVIDKLAKHPELKGKTTMKNFDPMVVEEDKYDDYIKIKFKVKLDHSTRVAAGMPPKYILDNCEFYDRNQKLCDFNDCVERSRVRVSFKVESLTYDEFKNVWRLNTELVQTQIMGGKRTRGFRFVNA